MRVRQFLGRAKREATQLGLFAGEYASARRIGLQRKANRGIVLPAVPASRRRPGVIWAVTMVRDEEDILALTIEHLLSQGIDHVLIADNRSTDGTPAALAHLAARHPEVHLAYDNEPAYYQAEKMSRLARWATSRGADWVLPFDADEFFFARGETVADFLRRTAVDSPHVGVVHADFHHMVCVRPAPENLANAEWCLDATASFPGKVAIRAHLLATLVAGNHNAARAGLHVPGLYVAHAIYRGPRQVARKIRQGAAAVNLAKPRNSDIANHWRKAQALQDEIIAEVWDNISHGRPDERINYRAVGPMITVTPLLWGTWDPHREIPDAPPMVADKVIRKITRL